LATNFWLQEEIPIAQIESQGHEDITSCVTHTIEKTKPWVTMGRKTTGPNGWDSRVAFGKIINILLKGEGK
jgi:hypothetical protein